MQSDAPSEGADGGVMDAASAAAIDAGRPAQDAVDTDEEDDGSDAASALRGDGGDADADLPRDAGDAAMARPDADAARPPPDPDPPGEDAPVISATGYFSDSLGTRLLVRGTDPNGDAATYRLGFLSDGAEVSFDIDGQGAVTSFTGDLAQPPAQADFSLTLDLSADFAAAVDALTITIYDAAGHASETRTAMKRATPTRALGETCDVAGFNRCAAGVCAPAGGTQYVCTATTTARGTACSAARVLRPPEVTSVTGTLSPYSLWDTPSGCAANDPKRRPDSVVVLRLDGSASTVTLSTRNTTTTFDSQLYLLTECTSSPPACIDASCACSDDAAGSLQSELVLRDLVAGDYLLVIDSLPSPDSASDAWELTVQID